MITSRQKKTAGAVIVVRFGVVLLGLFLPLAAAVAAGSAPRPNVILAMTDDQGWGEVSDNGHPHLKTPNLDAMAANGLRFDRFYAAAPVCTPTRASFLTGRHPQRCGIGGVGQPLPRQERTVGDLAKAAGYRTAFFGKWHLNGVGGPGKPIAADDPLSPGQFGFDHWLANSNYYDLDKELGSPHGIVPNKGDSSDVLAAHATEFIKKCVAAQQPFFVVVWYPSPHGGYFALPADVQPYAALVKNKTISEKEAHGYGEIAGVDRSVGALRQTLRELNVAENTLFFFCSDNGGALRNEKEGFRWSVGGLRGNKGTLWEGGVRVPGILEWPAAIPAPRTTRVVASTSDLYPTLTDLFGLDLPDKPKPLDGLSLMPLVAGNMEQRPQPLAFTSKWRSDLAESEVLTDTLLDYPWKYGRAKDGQEYLFNLEEDPGESRDLAAAHPERVRQMRELHAKWKESVENSARGKDYK